jgi:predicted Na+-dependent transporter
VTAFQIAIAISAIAILTRRKKLWFGSLVLTAIGIVFFIVGLLP